MAFIVTRPSSAPVSPSAAIAGTPADRPGRRCSDDRSSYAGINDRSSWVSDFNVFFSRLCTRSLESISCTVNVSSFIGTPTMVRPSPVTAVTVSYFSVAPPKFGFCVSLRLGSRIDSTR